MAVERRRHPERGRVVVLPPLGPVRLSRRTQVLLLPHARRGKRHGTGHVISVNAMRGRTIGMMPISSY